MITNVLPRFFMKHSVTAAYCYRWSVVCQSVCHDHDHGKNGWTDRDVVWHLDLGGPPMEALGGVHTGGTW